MRLSVLCDNSTIIDRYLIAEPGLSFLIQDEDLQVLFDVGYSDVFLQNAHRLRLDVLKTKYLILSHGHSDHTWGLEPLCRAYHEAQIESHDHTFPMLVAHPDIFFPKTNKRSMLGLKYRDEQIGCSLSQTFLEQYFDLHLTCEPFWLNDRLVFLGGIPRTNSFENQTPLGQVHTGGKVVDDYLTDDSALVYKASGGLVIITACSHAGICNIIDHAKNICQDDRIMDVIGGFHLLNPTKTVLDTTVQYFASLHPSVMHPCHCTDLKSKIALSGVASVQEVGSGLQLEYI